MAVFCLLCAKRFQTQKALQQHMEVHAGMHSYVCSHCEKPFECKICHQRSRDYSAMIKHLRTHNGASPYQCTICQDFCPSLAAMQKHMKSHRPEDVPPDWRIEKTYLYKVIPAMLSTVISNSCSLYEDYGNYGPPPYPRKNIRPRASLRHNPYNPCRPYLRRGDTRVSLADPKKISRATSRGQYVTMPVRHPLRDWG
ncbi:unnamed protein product, partial [Coregonus sp. 'balchen']